MEVSHRYINYAKDTSYHYLEIRSGDLFMSVRVVHYISPYGFQLENGIYESSDHHYLITKNLSNQKLAQKIVDLLLRGFYRNIHIYSPGVGIKSLLESACGGVDEGDISGYGVIQKWSGVKIPSDIWFQRIIPDLKYFCKERPPIEVSVLWDGTEGEFKPITDPEKIVDLFTKFYEKDESLS